MAGETVRVFDDDERSPEFEVDEDGGNGDEGAVAESWGSSNVEEVLWWLLLERWRGNVVLPGSKSSKCGVKPSMDAASVRRAEKSNKTWTTVIVQLLCAGVEQGKWGRDAVTHQLKKAQSPNLFAKVRMWRGKDNAVNFRAHVLGLVRQLLTLQDKGLLVPELLMSLPPALISMGQEETDEFICGHAGETHHLKVEGCGGAANEKWVPESDDDPDDPEVEAERVEGSKAWWAAVRRAGTSGAVSRETLVTLVEMSISVNITLDGGTWISISGVSLGTDRNCFLNGQTRAEQARPFEYRWLEAGDSVPAYCERVRPGDAAFLALALRGLDARRAEALRSLTRRPPRVLQDEDTGLEAEEHDDRRHDGEEEDEMDVDEDDDDVPPALDPNLQDGAQRAGNLQAAVRAAARLGEAQGSDAVTRWEDGRLNSIEFDEVTFVPKLDLDPSKESKEEFQARLKAPLDEAMLLRLPVVPDKTGSRPLPQAAWSDAKVMECACVCILHAAMRTGEAVFKATLQVRSSVLSAAPLRSNPQFQSAVK